MPTQVPLTNNAESKFRIKLEDRQLDFRVIFNSRNGTWSADISENDVDLINGIGLVMGVDILSSYNLDIGALVMVDTESLHKDATFDSLGTRNILLHYTSSELESM